MYICFEFQLLYCTNEMTLYQIPLNRSHFGSLLPLQASLIVYKYNTYCAFLLPCLPQLCWNCSLCLFINLCLLDLCVHFRIARWLSMTWILPYFAVVALYSLYVKFLLVAKYMHCILSISVSWVTRFFSHFVLHYCMFCRSKSIECRPKARIYYEASVWRSTDQSSWQLGL